MKRNTQRNLRVLSYTLLDLGAGVLLGVMLGLVVVTQVLLLVASQ